MGTFRAQATICIPLRTSKISSWDEAGAGATNQRPLPTHNNDAGGDAGSEQRLLMLGRQRRTQ